MEITRRHLRLTAPYFAPGDKGALKQDLIGKLPEPLSHYMTLHGIMYPFHRPAHFLAQCAHETDGFHTLEEYASGEAYEGREDLGNVHAGDGKRYKGRGIFQLTGRANYTRMAEKTGIPLDKAPWLAAEPEISVRIACIYWSDYDLNCRADADDLEAITRAINGGLNGLSDRAAYLANAKRAFELFPIDEVKA